MAGRPRTWTGRVVSLDGLAAADRLAAPRAERAALEWDHQGVGELPAVAGTTLARPVLRRSFVVAVRPTSPTLKVDFDARVLANLLADEPARQAVQD